jgi:hypothetical protein
MKTTQVLIKASSQQFTVFTDTMQNQFGSLFESTVEDK